jgi:ribosome-associated toxin RatA of RatAB toxin-antitoxin module
MTVAEMGCRVILIAEFELRSFLLQGIVNRALPGATAEVIAAFEARAHGLFQSTKIVHI